MSPGCDHVWKAIGTVKVIQHSEMDEVSGRQLCDKCGWVRDFKGIHFWSPPRPMLPKESELRFVGNRTWERREQ